MEKVTNWQQWKTANKSGLNPNIIESMSDSEDSEPELVIEKVINKKTAEKSGLNPNILESMNHIYLMKMCWKKSVVKHFRIISLMHFFTEGL